MFDFDQSKHSHFDNACRKFANSHNLAELAITANFRNQQMLRNKLNPEQPHKLTVEELLRLTDVTEDPTLLDGLLSQIQCLPAVPVNHLEKSSIELCALHATVEVGRVAEHAMSAEKLNSQAKFELNKSVNNGIRFLALAGLSIHERFNTHIESITLAAASMGVL